MPGLVNTLRKQVDLPVWEWLRFAPTASTAPSATASANNSQYNAMHGRYIYYLITAANFWRYDTWTDTYEQLATPPIAPATWADIEMFQGQAVEGMILGATTNTVTIPAFSSAALKGYDLRIIGGTGMGQRRIITNVAEPVIAETGVPTAVNNVLGALTITDTTKNWIVNQWTGYQVRISYGTGVGQVRKILYNSSTVLTLGDSTMSAQNIWCNPNIFSPAIVATAGSQSIYVIESSVASIDSNWLVQPDTTSVFRVESGVIVLASSAAATPWYTYQYYDILSDVWYIKTANTLNVSAVGTDGAMDHSGVAAVVWERGTATSIGTNTTLTDNNQNFAVNSLAGQYLFFVSGTGEGQLSKIASNTSTVITFASVTTPPDTTTNYLIEGYDCGTVSSGSTTAITDSTKTWPVNRFANFVVRVIFGTGKGQLMPIASNTATSLTLVKPFAVATDSTSVYTIIPDWDKSYLMLGGQAAVFTYNYTDDLMTEGRWQDSGIACSAVVSYSATRPIGIASAVHTTTNATITTTVPHGLKVGWSITVKGMTDNNYNTTATITSVPSTTTFTYTMSGTPAVDTVAGVQNTTALTDYTKNWTTNQWVGYQCYMTTTAVTATTGVATGQVLQVLANTPTTLIFASAGTAPVTGVSRYIITPRTTPGMMDNGLAYGTQSTTQLQDNSKASSINATVTAGSTTLTVNAVTFSASFANNVMTITAAPVNGVIQVGNLISGTGILPNTLISTLASGTANTVGATYNLIPLGASLATAGGSCSFSGTTMTITVVPTTAAYAIGQILTGTQIITAGTTIVSVASGTPNTIGCVYNLSATTTTGTAATTGTFGIGFISSQTVTAYPQGLLYPGQGISTTGSSGGQMSFATNVATLTTPPTYGSVAIGQVIQSAGAASNAVIVALASGAMNATSSTYTLSTTPGTISAQNATTSNLTALASGGSASFATNVMTITVAPTTGSVAIGQYVVATGVATGTYITGLLSGNLNAVSSTYSLSTTPGTIGAESFTAYTGAGCFGGSASFATNQMTITVAPTVGGIVIGQVVTSAGVMAGTTITGLVSGNMNAISSVYSLSSYPGTISAQVFTTQAIQTGSVIVKQLTSTMPNGTLGGAGTYQMSLPATANLYTAPLSYGWPINCLAGRKLKIISAGGQGNTSEISITSNTATTITCGTLGAAPVTLASGYSILQQPARGTGFSLQGIFGTTSPNNAGKWWIAARGGAAVGFDKWDITTDTFYMLPTAPMTETLTTGSQYAYDGQDRLYFTKEATQRMYYIDLTTNIIHGAGMYPYSVPTATLGNRMEIFSTADNLKYLWLNRQGFTEAFRELLFY